MSLVQFNTLSDKFLMKILGKLLDEAAEDFGWLMYKNKGKTFLSTNDHAIDEDFFLVFFFPLKKMLKMWQ